MQVRYIIVERGTKGLEGILLYLYVRNIYVFRFPFQQPHRPFPNLFLHELESLGRQIIPYMPLKPKSQQLSELFPVFVGHKAFGGGEKVVVYARNEGVDVLLKCFGAFIIFRSGLIEQRISVVKERGGRGDGVGNVVDHKAEIAVVPVCVADHRVKHQHIAESLLERFAEFFIIGYNCVETAFLHQIADGHIGVVDVGEQLAGGTEPTFPF